MRTPRRAVLAGGACALAFSCLAFGCSHVEEREPIDLEHFAFVPSGQCVLGRGARVVCSNPRPLLVDRYEVTRGDFKKWYPTRGARKDPLCDSFLSTWKADTASWPASFMTLPEAREYAASRGLRLLTAREWMRVACGTSERPYDFPWGGKRAVSVANTLELDLRCPVPVGTFEQGRTPLSIYDVSGNVWEWVDDPIAAGERTSGLAWAMGGSYLSHLRRLYDDSQDPLRFDEQDLDELTRSVDVGFRCCADAEEYLSKHAQEWAERCRDEEMRETLLAVGAGWGRDAVPLLEELNRRPGAPESLVLLLAGARR